MQKAICLLALLVVAATATICPTTTCDSSLTDNKCAVYTKSSDSWKIKKCDTGKYCKVGAAGFLVSPTADVSAVCETDPTPGTPATITGKYPGYACNEDSNCALKCSSGSCTGLAENATDCVAYATDDTAANNAKMCGANLYCNSEKKCVKGISDTSTACTNSYECAGRSACIDKKCAAIASLAKDATCTGLFYCVSDYVCSGGKCVEATTFADGKSYGMQCANDAACGAKGSCSCTAVNKAGDGTCSLSVADGANTSYGKAALNTARNAIKGASFNCPLGMSKLTMGGCAGTATGPSVTTNYDSCFKGFKITGGELVSSSSTSSYGLFLSVFGFVAYLLA